MIHNWLLGTFILAYLLGSIPFGLLLTKYAGLGDIRAIGSGNIGATNVMRTGNKKLGIATLLLDAAKGAIAVLLVRQLYSEQLALLAALFVVIGHIYPVWLRFKGGKGVATSIGALFGLHWMLGVAVCAIWLAVFSVKRISSLAALVSISLSPVAALLLASAGKAVLCVLLAALIIYTHRANIERLRSGTEPTFKAKES